MQLVEHLKDWRNVSEMTINLATNISNSLHESSIDKEPERTHEETEIESPNIVTRVKQ